jgi:peptidoglycan L-alanyl-D-glutamate endopeptidase CwlK
MPSFSSRSLAKLATCRPELQRVAEEVIKHWDCTVLDGHRSAEAQAEAFEHGRSKLAPGTSKHNAWLSEAIDLAPYPVDWNDTQRFYFFAGYVLGVAESMGVKLRWGGDWDSDHDVHDQTFFDLVHFEIA